MFCNFSAGLAISLHLMLSEEYNALHPYLLCDFEVLSVGATINSLSAPSFFAFQSLPLGERLELDYGLVTGYEKMNETANLPVIPLLRLTYDAPNSIKYFAIPVVEMNGSSERIGLAIGAEIPIGK